MERRAFLSLTAVAAAALSGCARPAPESAAPAAPGASGKKLRAGLVTDVAGIDDRSFNTQAWTGLEKARDTLGMEVKAIESRQNADYVPNLTQFAKAGYDIVFAVGFLMKDAVEEVARRFPDVRFALIDAAAPDLPNCVAYTFREQEGAFLVGALAALVSKSHTIGFVGGMEVPLIKKFETGYQAGASAADPRVQVRVGYANSFDDTQKGREIALLQMGTGADVIFHASGRTGLGVIKAVQGKGEGFYAIGVDRDQDDEAPGRVLVSMVKRVDTAVFEVCRRVKEGAFAAGTIEQGLAENALGLSEMRFTKDKLPAGAMAKVDALRAKIVDGALKPPSTPEELARFEAPPAR